LTKEINRVSPCGQALTGERGGGDWMLGSPVNEDNVNVWGNITRENTSLTGGSDIVPEIL